MPQRHTIIMKAPLVRLKTFYGFQDFTLKHLVFLWLMRSAARA